MFFDGLNETEKARVSYEEHKRPGSRLGAKIEKPRASLVVKKATIEKASQTDPFDFEAEYKKLLLENTFEMKGPSFKLDENVRSDFMGSDDSFETQNTSETDETIESDFITNDRSQSSQGIKNIYVI